MTQHSHYRARLLACLSALLLLLFSLHAVDAGLSASSRASHRHPIKINPGPTDAAASATAPSHTFVQPEPDPPTIHNQANAIRASKSPAYRHSAIPHPQQPSPANFSLPPPLLAAEADVQGAEVYEEALWRRWEGDCMGVQQDGYQYTLCPFHNVTQRGLQLTSLHVLLGVWSGWWVTPSRQLAMNYTTGTRCSDQLTRSTTVTLHCSAPRSMTRSAAPLPPIDTLAEYSPSHIARVEEPATCVYVVHWHTPLVCSAYRQAVADGKGEEEASSDRAGVSLAGGVGSARRQRLERELDEDDGAAARQSEHSLADVDSAVVRGYLDCIAAMSAPQASADTHHSQQCAAYLPLGET